jgi:hypothetical protein
VGSNGVRTDAQLRALICPPGVKFLEASVCDPQLPGFVVRAYLGGRKVFFLLYRFNRERRRLKIGLYTPPDFGLAAARAEARRRLAALTIGEDPAATNAMVRRADDVRSLYLEVAWRDFQAATRLAQVAGALIYGRLKETPIARAR